MNRGGREPDPGSGLTGSPLERRAGQRKPNRLSRSFRRTQSAAEAGPPSSQRADFKTPTRIHRSRTAGGFSGESPHNESDFQQDIIWDATSPSPCRLGRKGRKQPAGVVNISEIVSRIAPKHGRPEAAEPTLQQWIGDSATIPCTPDVQVPKPKRKSPRSSAVDDLLKLAKQFDFNMFRHDEEEVEDMHQQRLELLSEDISDFENGDQRDFSPSFHGNCEPAVSAAAGTDVQVRPDQHTEDDLDFLFDGPTQHVSGNLSQVSSAQPSQVKPAPALSSKEASGKTPAADVSTTNPGGGTAKDEFEDDWENDDLLNDSLVLEMTQNPQSFTAPQHCSTQKPPSVREHRSPAAPAAAGLSFGQSAVSKVEKENVRQRATFKLESNPISSEKRLQTNTWTNWEVDYSSETAGGRTQQSSFSCRKGFSGESGSQRRTWQTSNTVKSDQQRTSVSSSVSALSASITSFTKTAVSFPKRPQAVSPHVQPAAVSDFLDEDLDSFFSSETLWDDTADDDLLCEICEDLENQIQSLDNVSTKQTPLVGQTSNQRAVLQPSNRIWDSSNQQPANRQPVCPTAPPGGSGSTNSSTCQRGSSRVQSASAAPPPPPQGKTSKDQFTFKKPNNPVSTVTDKVRGKCSAAEIELKKQQAMERRRQRLQAAQNLRALT
ncbi:ewing's tumor-associated antigen 1 isoform X2 [Toxotes jaculatrix]|uniref:ewing's tumor-associated antigen 1 isoform X2 n=1 Tax=Toxotes jaculatrix TaxID=941984 RepID=UPI001B3A9103|nr:ewing's tumor-associated antigen 1 isoform X2 [Toxotes jaculatrix]